MSVSPTDYTPPTGAAYSLAIFATAPWPLVSYSRPQVCCRGGATAPAYTNMVPDNMYATKGCVVPLAGIPPQVAAGDPACTPYH